MKKIFSFTKKKKHPSGTPDNGSVLSAGYDLREKDLGKVHKAASLGDLAKLKQLAKKNDINQLDKENRTALHIACASGHVEVVQFLVESKVKLNLCDNQNRSALMKAVQGQHERCVSILLENHAEPNLLDINGNTALHLTSNIPSISTAVLLLEHEADINAQNKEGFTPLTVSVREDHLEMAEFLLKEGADVNVLDRDQRSPLMIAAGNGQIGMLRLLLRFDADITLKDTKGWSADDYAVMNGHHPCSLIIIEHGTQRNDGPSLPHPGKKKKKTLLGSPSQDLEAGFSLGGPATDKDDFEDNSRSESLSRVSKSAADEWPSSEDDDDSVLIEKKPQKVNLRKMIATKKGEASAVPDKSLSGSESDPESDNRVQRIPSLQKAVPPSTVLQHPVDPSPASFLSNPPLMSSTLLSSYTEQVDSKRRQVEGPSSSDSHDKNPEAEDSEEEVGDEEEEEEEEDDDNDDEEEEEEEEEEEDDEDDDDENEEDSEEEEEEEEEDDECEDEDGDCVASVEADTAGLQEIQETCVTGPLEIINGVDAGNVQTEKREPQNDDIVCLAGTSSFETPGPLGVEEDCVVSAIRVESKFSDEDDSPEKEHVMSSDLNVISGLRSRGCSTPSKHRTETHSPNKVEEEKELEKEDDSWSSKQDSGNSAWNDSDDNEDNQTGAFSLLKVLDNLRNIAPEGVEAGNIDSPSDDDDEDDDGSKQEKLRSSWGSSSEDNDDCDLPKEEEVNKETLVPESDIQASDLLPGTSILHLKQTLSQQHEAQRDISSPKCTISPQELIDEHKLASSPRSKNKVASNSKGMVSESDWDTSENPEVLSPVPGSNVTVNQTGEEQCSDGKESDDSSHAVSPAPEEEAADRNQICDDDCGVESTGQLSRMDCKSDPENQKGDDSSWDDDDDDDDDGDELEKCNTKDGEVADCDETAIEVDDEKVPQCITDRETPKDNGPEEVKRVVVDEDNNEKDDTSEDSDSKDQKLQYDVARAMVKVSDVEDDSDDSMDGHSCGRDKSDHEDEARLTAYVKLGNKSSVLQSGPSSNTVDDEPMRENIYSSPANKEDACQHHHADRNMLSDEEIPHTDIDDVDVDSPDEAENLGMRCPEVRNIEELAVQKGDSSEDEDDYEKEEERDEEEEEDSSDDQPEESGDSHDDAEDVPDMDLSKDNKRDFHSELGLEKGEEEQDSSYSESENASMPRADKQSLQTQNQEETSSVEERRKVANDSKDDIEGERPHKQDSTQKEAKWEPLLSKLEGAQNQTTDVMEEFGVGDFDDLEDASDWDTASITSRRTLSGLPQCSIQCVKEEEEISPTAPLTPQRSINSDKKHLSTPPLPVPRPQPRARKTMLQEGEDSDCERDNSTSSCKTAKSDHQLHHPAELPALLRPCSTELSTMERDSQSHTLADKQQQEEKDGALDLNYPYTSGHMGSDSGEKDNEFRDHHSPEERGEMGDDIPWEKRYEKLWVEVEKREVKSTFKNVAGELKEKFGELFNSRRTAEDITEEEQAVAESTSAEEESSDDEEGDVITRPAARARTTVLLAIPEQRESGLEDSVTESNDNSLCHEKMLASERSMWPEPEPLASDALVECRSSPPHLTTAKRERNIDSTSAAFNDGHTLSVFDVGHRSFLKDENKHGPFHKQQLDPIFKNNADLDETEKNRDSPKKDPKELAKSQPCLLSRGSASIPGISDEELEEDMERFKPEVGMLKVVFLDSEKEKAQLRKEVSTETATTAFVERTSSASRNIDGMASEGAVTEKPETRLGCQKELSNQAGATQEEQRPAATKSTSRAPVQLQLPLQQTHNNNKQEEQAVEERSQLDLVREARGSRTPLNNAHVNGDLLSVFDDSSISDVSDDEGRLKTGEQLNTGKPEEMEMAEDFDELTQSSDTATDDIDSPTSGYRHASLLIQKLDSVTLDSRSMVKLQNIFHEYERSIQKARSRHGYLSDKVSQLELERAELKSCLEDVKDFKSALERNQLELQTEVTNLKFQLKQEQENGRNATMMYNTSRDKLRRTEEQQQLEVQERQKVELTLRNLELEMRTLMNNRKQLEEDHSQTQRLLAQERSARTLQENLLNSHLRKQKEIEEENKRNISKSNEALSQLTEASDRERELLQQTSTLQEQLNILRTDHEHLQAKSSLKERDLLEENEALKEQLEDARRDLKLNGDTLTQTVFSCNNQMTTFKSDLAITATRLDNERQGRETLAAELDSVRTRLAGAVQETERCMAALTDTERALLREKEEHQRLKDKLTGEASSQREAVGNLSQKLAKAEVCANNMENEVHRATLQLTEKGLLLDVLQREKDQIAARVKELETTLQAERDLVSRAGARQEATQERLAQAQSEAMLLRQQLEEAQNKGVAKERAVTDAQECFRDTLSKLRSDCEDRVQLVEERNKELASKAADFRDHIYKLEEEKNERETSLRQRQQELADSLKKLSMSEASLEVNTRYRNDLEEEKVRLFKDMDRLKAKLEESETQYVQAERRISSLKNSVDEREKEVTTVAQKLQVALSSSEASDTTVKQLEEAVQRLEIENARLEAAAKQQSNKLEALQKGAQEGAMVRGRLEDLVANLQSSKMTLEDQLSREVQKQSMLSHTAKDSQALWEEELKSRSKLGLRLAELDKQKEDLNTQMEIEKKKAKKIAEQKKAVDSRLDQEMNRNTELQKEMYRMRTLLKTTKKKLRDQNTAGVEFGSPMNSLRMDMGRHSMADGAVGRMKEKVDDLQVQLDKEASHRSQLERVNRELKDQLASLNSFSHSNDQLERSKRQLEEEVLDLRRRMEATQLEQSQVEQYQRVTEEKARQEVQQKLEQVNLFLQSQAASQEALDQIKAANETNLRSQMEQKIRELESELGRARTNQYDSLSQRDSTRTELERFRQLYTEELHHRKSMAAKLDRANSRLSEANSKLLNERSRSLITSSFANSSLGGPSLDVGSLSAPANYGATLGPLNRSLGLGISLLSPVTEGQNSRVEDYLAKMQSELDRNISRELNNATAELDVASVRMSPVGSASRVELDPVSRAKQQYLEVLKKNNMI